MKMAIKEMSKSMIVAVLAAVMLVNTTNASTYYDVECEYAYGDELVYAGDGLSSVTCPTTGYTMISCGMHSNWGGVLGSYIENDICYVEHDSDGTGFVKAYTWCCTLPTGSSCSSVNTRLPTYSTITVDCSSSTDNVLVSCSINDDSGSSSPHFKGVYAGDYYSNNSLDVLSSSVISSCTGTSFDGWWNTFTTGARCCSTPADYRLECYSVWSYDAGYSDTCDTGYFMSGCTAINKYENSIRTNRVIGDKCYTTNLDGDDQYVQRTCCRIAEGITPSPTTDPTDQTPLPTLLPTPEPTTTLEVCYAQCCSSSSSSSTSSGDSSGSAVVAPMPVTQVLGSLIEFGEISMIVTDFQAVVFSVTILAVIMSCLYACVPLLSKLCDANNKYAGVGKYEIFEKENGNENEIENHNENVRNGDDTELVN